MTAALGDAESREEHASPFVLQQESPGGFVTRLRRVGDTDGPEFIRPGSSIGPVTLRVRTPEGAWREVNRDADGVEIRSVLRPEEDALLWDVSVRNAGREPLEIGDLALPLPMNTDYVWDAKETFERRVFKHAFIAGHGSFLYWLPVKGTGPILVLQPRDGTRLEFFTSTGMNEFGGERFAAFVHSRAAAEQESRGTWRQPHTGRTLQPGEQAANGFAFRWADSYRGVRDLLFEHGGADVHVAPGMVIPRDLTAMVALRTKRKVETIVSEFPADTRIESLGERIGGHRVYRIRFNRLGENLLTVCAAGGWTLPLEFFVTEPLETLIRKRAAFITAHQQHRDPARWYDGLFSLWDRRQPEGRNLLGPDHLAGQPAYAVSGSDDPSNSKCLFLSEKERRLSRRAGDRGPGVLRPELRLGEAAEDGRRDALPVRDLWVGFLEGESLHGPRSA